MSWGNANIGSSGGGNVTSVNGKTGIVNLNAFDVKAAPSIQKIEIKLKAENDEWQLVEGKDNLYYIPARIISEDYMITNLSKIDLQPDDTVINQLYEDGVIALYVVNDQSEEGNFTQYAYALGNAPSVELTMQATLTDMGTIPGNVPITYIENEYGGYTAIIGAQNISTTITYTANDDGGYTATIGAQEV